MKIRKNIFVTSLFCSMLFIVACNDEYISETSVGDDSSIRNTMLKFSSKQDLQEMIVSKEGENAITRAVSEGSQSKSFVSLMDVIKDNDPILEQFTTEERAYIKDNALSYYDVFEYEDLVPNEAFARLLNSKGELQVNDSIYRIAKYGTLCAHIKDTSKLDEVYSKLDENSMTFDNDILLKLSDHVTLINSFNRISFVEESTRGETNIVPTTRTAIESIPYGTFPHFYSESHTFVGKQLGHIFGDRSVKHHNFMDGFRVKGSLYDYDYGAYSEVGTFVAMRKKRGGFFKGINGWKGTNADELSVAYRGIILEMNTKLPDKISIPPKATLINNNIKLDMAGVGKQLLCLDICGLSITDKDVMKFAGMGIKAAVPELKKMLGININNNVQAVRIMTQSKVYVVILDNQINEYNVEQVRKVFSSGVKFYISSSMIKNPLSIKSAVDFMSGLRSLPVKRMKGGEVILAGKLNNRWGGMIIKKN